MKIIDEYFKALNKIYEHVGFEENYVVLPIEDATDFYWTVDEYDVKYAKDKNDVLNETGEYYSDEIYTQRFYTKWIYKGKDFTMIFCNPQVDGMRYFRLFSNNKKIKEEEKI